MKIAIDFDGVLCRGSGVPRDHDFTKERPMDNALEAVSWLLKEKHEIYVLTGRPEKEWADIQAWLARWGFPPLYVTNLKEEGTQLFIDDRAIRFTNWQDVCKLIG